MKLKRHFEFVTNNFRLLSFGFFIALSSSFGQSFFIGVIGPAVRDEFILSQSSWSAIYMLGTLASAMLLPFTGQLIDKISLPYYTAMVVMFLGFASLFMALVPSTLFLFFAIFLLRQGGQGLMSHTSFIAMARYFPKNRGKAAAIASFGLSAGQALLPLLMVLSISLVGWRFSYGIIGVATILFILPLSLWLLKGYMIHGQHNFQPPLDNPTNHEKTASWSRVQVLRDFRFYLLLPGVSAPSLVITALFFHNLTLAELKQWDVTWFLANYWFYAAGSLLSAIATGPLIDRITAVRVLPLFLIPMVVALLIIWAFNSQWWAIIYLLSLGITAGVTYTGLTALWAEIYGVDHLGAIKSLYSSIAIFASALGPLAMGIMLDSGISIEKICLVLAGYCMISTGFMIQSISLYRVRKLP